MECRYCGGRLPDVALADHYSTCPGTPLARAESALLTSWVAASAEPARGTSEDLSDALIDAVAECVRRVELTETYDWGAVSDVLDEWIARLTPYDFTSLYLAGLATYERLAQQLPTELEDDHRRAPVRTAVVLGMMQLVGADLGLEMP
jgi:hypothetical protein